MGRYDDACKDRAEAQAVVDAIAKACNVKLPSQYDSWNREKVMTIFRLLQDKGIDHLLHRLKSISEQARTFARLTDEFSMEV